MNNKKGFTIIELIVVIAIIAVLAGIVLVSVNGYISKARNVRRISDVTSYVKALSLYYVDKGKYPDMTDDGPPEQCCLGRPYPTTYNGLCAYESHKAPCGSANPIINEALSAYLPGQPFGDYGGLSNEYYGYLYKNPDPNGLGLFTIDYTLEGQWQKCGIGTYIASVNDITFCKYIQY